MMFCFFFFNDTATTEIYTLSLHDALPISRAHGRAETGGAGGARLRPAGGAEEAVRAGDRGRTIDRKSTRLNSSHLVISYAVFCLKKKKQHQLTRGTELQQCSNHDQSPLTP